MTARVAVSRGAERDGQPRSRQGPAPQKVGAGARGQPRIQLSWPDIGGLAWVIGAAIAVLLPTLVHGSWFGPFNLLSHFGLSQQSGVALPNRAVTDQVQELAPWTALAWTQVHHGQLPLWNPYSALGLPLAFNWQSAPFSLGSLVGYIFPLSMAFTASVVVTLVVAGTGAYFLGRVLGLGVLGSAMAATVFELSGQMMGWLGYSLTPVMSFAGWMFGATVLLLHGRRRVLAAVLLAVSVAGAANAGQPEIFGFLVGSAALFGGVVLVQRLGRRGSGPIGRPLRDTVLAGGAGLALAAPMLLPSLQYGSHANATQFRNAFALPVNEVSHFLFASFDGLLPGLPYSLGFGGFYPETLAYVGAIALVLVVCGFVVYRRRPEVVGLAAVLAVLLAVAFVPAVTDLANGLPKIGHIDWLRTLMPADFVLAVLAGYGADAVVSHHRDRQVQRWLLGGFVTLAVLVAAIWIFGRGHLPSPSASARAHSFVWPVILILVGLVVSVWLWRRRPSGSRPGRAGAIGIGQAAVVMLLMAETAFLVAVGSSLPQSSSTGFVPTPAEASLQRAVGSALVGFGVPSCWNVEDPGLGIVPNVNTVFGVHEFGVYDAMAPQAYYSSGPGGAFYPVGDQVGACMFGFYPALRTASEARHFGVGYVLEPGGSPGPTGSIFDRTIADEDLYRIPGAAPAALVSATGSSVTSTTSAESVRVTQPDPGIWRVTTDAPGPTVLQLHLTAVPGWHATIDGRALPLRTYSAVMLEATLPPGRHLVELHYWPATFPDGLILAVLALVALVALVVGARLRVRPWRRS